MLLTTSMPMSTASICLRDSIEDSVLSSGDKRLIRTRDGSTGLISLSG